MINRLKRVDWLLVVPGLYLIAIGLVTQYAIAYKTRGIQVQLDLRSQIFAFLLGVAAAVVLAYLQPASWRRVALWAHGVVTLLLVGVLFFGQVINGAARWISIGGFQFQPAEIAKVTLIIALARVLGKQRPLRTRDIVVSFALTAVPAALILLQPDLGTAVSLIVIWMIMLAASNLSLRYVATVFMGLFGAAALSYPFLQPYQQQRILSFLNPSLDTSGANYNAAQASIAIGSGGLFGKGLASGSQSLLNFLPSQNTDFIFAVVAEKLGLLGAGSVIVGLAVVCIRLVQLALTQENQFQRLVIVGIGALIFFHSVVNIGMNLGVAPVTGLPLPFVSYGGTFLSIVVALVGMVLVVEVRRKRPA